MTLGKTVFREITSSAILGIVLFTFVLFLQRVGRLFELLVRSSMPIDTIGLLFILVLPFVLTFTIPVGVLVGTLIGLSRMASDGEITAMRAAGVPGRRVFWPVMAFAALATAAAAATSLWLTPLSIQETYRVLNKLVAEQMTAEIRPRVFEETLTNTILYVGDVEPGPVTRWKKVFMADLTPAGERISRTEEASDDPRITVAAEAIAVADVERSRIQVSMLNGRTYEVGKDPAQYFNTGFPKGDQVLVAEPPEIRTAKAYSEMPTFPLMAEAEKSVDARIELHQRFALPLGCILLALVGLPLGVSTRKAGKSTAIVMTVLLAFTYYMALISLIGVARQGTLPAGIAVWMPNIVFAITGIILLARLERPGDRDWVGTAWTWIGRILRGLLHRLPSRPGPLSRRSGGRMPLLPQIVDTYILNGFLFYFGLLLASFVLMTHVYQFFELLGDVIRNNIPMQRVFAFLFFLTPKLLYDLAPLSVLVAVLVTFGILTKNNEVAAMKACGVSLHRLAIPILLMSAGLSGALFAFDHYVIPDTNRKQDAIRNEIRGKPIQTYLRPDRKWIFGNGSRIYYYRYFDPVSSVMGGISVYELDPGTFRLTRHISAERALWQPSLKTWIFQNGWMRELGGGTDGETFRDFRGQTATFPELNEPPSYFLKEVKQDKQMNFHELAGYIRELQQSGFDTVRLQVQFYKKFSVPLFVLIMALIAIPFAFVTGNRGAMAGVGVSLGIAITYLATNSLFEQMGNVAQLPPQVAAWSPDAVFSLAGLYMMARMKS
ncbi:MAG TPA: LptF/LptG family permease [Bryobacteraceae bacterium]|nr:LptF/LptG family permease [Bryobacteraceae bacterium]